MRHVREAGVGEGCQPAVERGVGQGWRAGVWIDFIFVGLLPPRRVRLFFRVEQWHSVVADRVTVGRPFMGQIFFAERDYFLTGIAFVGQRKIRILGEGPLADRAFPSRECGGSLGNSFAVYDKEDPFAAAIPDEASGERSTKWAFPRYCVRFS